MGIPLLILERKGARLRVKRVKIITIKQRFVKRLDERTLTIPHPFGYNIPHRVKEFLSGVIKFLKIYVDRIETLKAGGKIAALRVEWEDFSAEWLVPLDALPNEVQEGDWLDVRFETDPALRKERRAHIERLQRELNQD